MPVLNWNQTVYNGRNYLVVDLASLMVPLDWDPSSNVVLLVAAPTGGVLDYPALATGDPGAGATIDNDINFTALDYTDPTPDDASLTTLSPGNYQLNLTLHRGPQGIAGANTVIGSTDLVGTPISKKMLIVNPTQDGIIYATQKVGDMYVPASISNTASGNPTSTLCTVGIPAMDFDWRPIVHGYTVIAGTGTNVAVDLIARLNGTAGNDIGRCPGVSSAERLTLSDCPPPGVADIYNRVLAGNPATIYLRAERQTGTDTFTTTAATTRFGVRVGPIP